MKKLHIGYAIELHFPEEDNLKWIPNEAFEKAQKLWIKSGNNRATKEYAAACNSLSQYFTGEFDREKIISHFAEQVASQDEDGWVRVSEEDKLYGFRKSIFAQFDPETYEREPLMLLAVAALDFRSRGEDGSIEEEEIQKSPYINLIAIKEIDVKDQYSSVEKINEWSEKNNIELSSCFDIQVAEELTTYVDEDGFESSSFSNEKHKELMIIKSDEESLEEFVNRLGEIATSEQEEIVLLYGEALTIFEAIVHADLEKLKRLLSSEVNINQPLAGAKVTAPLQIAFSLLFFDSNSFREVFSHFYDEIPEWMFGKALPAPPKAYEEIVYFLVSQGANLSDQFAGMSYLAIAVGISNELTEFLLSYGAQIKDDGANIIRQAASCGKAYYVDLAIKKGVSPDATEKGGTTALLYAAQGEGNKEMSEERQKEQIKIIDLLLDAGADINYIDKGGDSALTNAIRTKAELIVQHLISRDIRVNTDSSTALIPLKLAKEMGDTKIIRILEEKGANVNPPIPKGKVACPDCGQIFSEATIKKWGGKCGRCHNKSVPQKEKKAINRSPQKTAPARKSQREKTSFGEKVSNIFEASFLVLKFIAIVIVLGLLAKGCMNAIS